MQRRCRGDIGEIWGRCGVEPRDAHLEVDLAPERVEQQPAEAHHAARSHAHREGALEARGCGGTPLALGAPPGDAVGRHAFGQHVQHAGVGVGTGRARVGDHEVRVHVAMPPQQAVLGAQLDAHLPAVLGEGAALLVEELHDEGAPEGRARVAERGGLLVDAKAAERHERGRHVGLGHLHHHRRRRGRDDVGHRRAAREQERVTKVDLHLVRHARRAREGRGAADLSRVDAGGAHVHDAEAARVRDLRVEVVAAYGHLAPGDGGARGGHERGHGRVRHVAEEEGRRAVVLVVERHGEGHVGARGLPRDGRAERHVRGVELGDGRA